MYFRAGTFLTIESYLYLYLKDTKGTIFGFVSYLQDTRGVSFVSYLRYFFNVSSPTLGQWIYHCRSRLIQLRLRHYAQALVVREIPHSLTQRVRDTCALLGSTRGISGDPMTPSPRL